MAAGPNVAQMAALMRAIGTDLPPNLRNGGGGPIEYMYTDTAIAAAYYAIDIDELVAQWTAHETARKAAAVVGAAAPAPNDPTDWNTIVYWYGGKVMAKIIRDNVGAAASRPYLAMGIAASRVAIYRYWNIGMAEIEPAQVEVCTGTFTAAHVYTPGVNDNLTAAQVAAGFAAVDAAMNDDLGEYMALAARTSLGVVVTASVTYENTGGHHFVGKEKAVSTAVVKQVFKDRLTGFNAISRDDILSNICHDVPHIISSATKRVIAYDEAVTPRMDLLGLGSATVRHPAKYPGEKRMSAVLALLDATLVPMAEANYSFGTLRADVVAAAAGFATKYSPPGGARVGAQAARAIDAEVLAYLGSITSDIAVVAGFNRAMVAAAMDGGAGADGARVNSLLTSEYIKRVMADNYARVAAGAEGYELAARYRRDVAGRGTLVGRSLYGVAPPAALVTVAPADPMIAALVTALAGGRRGA